MEDTITQTMFWIQIGVLAAFLVLMSVALSAQLSERKFSPISLVLRASYSIAAFFVLLFVTGVSVNWLWAAVFAGVGSVAGFFAGKTSQFRRDADGVWIKRSSWPILVSALAYLLTLLVALWGTTDLFSVSMLFVAFGAMMTDGAAIAEIMAGTSGKAAPSASVGVPGRG